MGTRLGLGLEMSLSPVLRPQIEGQILSGNEIMDEIRSGAIVTAPPWDGTMDGPGDPPCIPGCPRTGASMEQPH